MSDELLDAYAAWMRSWDAAPNTITARLTVLRPRLEQWGGVTGVTTANIEAWLASLPPDKPWTKSTYYSHAKSLCDWLVATHRLPEHPMTGGKIRPARRPKGVPRALSEVEVTRALEAASGDLRTWLVLALSIGLRAHEIAKLRGEDVGEDHVFVRGKGGVLAELPTHPDVWALAQGYPRQGYWFPANTDTGHIPRERISTKVGLHFRKCGIPHGSIHRARHLYATRLLRRGAHIRLVQKLMRHADVATTSGYTAVDEDELRAAILLLPSSEPPAPPLSA